jgi:hypothetical protein
LVALGVRGVVGRHCVILGRSRTPEHMIGQ